MIEIIEPGRRRDVLRPRRGRSCCSPASPPAARGAARATWRASRTPSCAAPAPGCPTACGCCRCSSSRASTRRRSGALAAAGTASPAAPVGVTEQGVFTLDLERDGPHALVGGTTGSGKSELLRSLIAALAANADPRQLTFLLMDFKGGAAFDACARLPHTVGMVTDLDEELVERALRALEAELQYRERLLRSVGADNLRAYHEREHDEPLPRLVVVIDEFAKMARELPELLSALVDVAQRGRTLGVHLILATQRPAGVVNDHIRTNTNLRIALRVQDAADSIDVIGDRAAAELSRHRPGARVRAARPRRGRPDPERAGHLRRPDATTRRRRRRRAVHVRRDAARARPRDRRAPVAAEQPSDLARLVDAIVEANAAEGIAPPRRPWPEPLSEQIDLAELLPEAVRAADEPRRQAQYPVGWDLDEGNLLLLGIPGSGTTTALASLALSLATSHAPDALELYAFDFGTGELAGARGAAARRLGDRGRRPRAPGAADPLAAPRPRRAGAPAEQRPRNGRPDRQPRGDARRVRRRRRPGADGRARPASTPTARRRGIYMAVTADRPNTVPTAVAGGHDAEVAVPAARPLRLRVVRAEPQGRAVRDARPGRDGRDRGADPARARRSRPSPRWPRASPRATRTRRPPPTPIGVLPGEVALASLVAARSRRSRGGSPSACGSPTSASPNSSLYEGEHAIVAGPARSGKSLALWTIAAVPGRPGDGSSPRGPPLAAARLPARS